MPDHGPSSPRPRSGAALAAAALAAALAGCTGVIADPNGSSGGGAVDVPGDGETPTIERDYGEFTPAPSAMRRLTARQYRNVVEDVFGPDVRLGAELEADEETEIFSSIGASQVATSNRGVEQYRAAALDIAAQVVSTRAHPALETCAPTSSTDDCIEDVVGEIGSFLFRRPLEAEEIGRYASIVGAAGEDPALLELGLTYALAALLQSPSFLYVPQVGEPDADLGLQRFTSLEMASRLSLFLWDSGPDQELLDAALRGDLDAPAGVEAQARRMLEAPRARTLPSRFFGEAWNIAKLVVEDKNATAFPDWGPELLASHRGEVDHFLEDLVFDRDGDVREVLVGTETFVDSRLAAFYGMDVDAGDGFVRAPLGDLRRGLLTSGAVVSANSPSDRTSPTHRGLFVVERILCEEIPPPPANVDDVLDASSDPAAPTTLRERLEQHRTDPVCAGCHGLFDPLGLTFESFDAIGRFRTEDDGIAVDTSGELDGTTFHDVTDLADYLYDDPRTPRCVTEQLYELAVGHELEPGEAAVVDSLSGSFVADGHRFRELAVALVTSDGFRYLAVE